ncbi:MAG: sulfotransferase [Glycocaulis sp.]
MLAMTNEDPLARLLAARMSDNLLEVSQVARALLAANPPLGTRWSEVATLLNEAGDLAALLQASQKLTEAVPGDPQSWLWLATAYTQMDDHVSALKVLQPLLAANPSDAGLTRRVGRLLLELGLLAEAQTLFRSALAANPEDVMAWEGLALAKIFTRDDDDLVRLDQLRLSAGESLSARDRGILAYTLAKAYEDIGEYDIASRRVAEAAAFYRADAPFDLDQHEEGVRRILDVYDERFAGHNLENGLVDSRPVFVMAPPCCGASWLSGVLGVGEDFSALPRKNALFWMSASSLGDQTREHIMAALSGPQEGGVLSQVAMTYLERVAELTGPVRRWVDPTTLGEMAGGAMGLCLPAARFVRIKRDPLDAAWAILKQRFVRARHWTYHPDDIARTLAAHDRLVARWEQIFPDRFLTVSYEDLVGNTEDEVRRIAFFAGVDTDAAVEAAQARAGKLAASPPGIHARAGARIEPVREALQRAGLV